MGLTAHDNNVPYDISFPYDVQGTVCTSSHCKLFIHCLSHGIVHRLERMSKENSELRLLLEKEGQNKNELNVENCMSNTSKEVSFSYLIITTSNTFHSLILSVESACISSLSLSIDVIFHSPYYVHSQEVRCCLVPCFECVFLLKVHVFLLFLYPLT